MSEYRPLYEIRPARSLMVVEPEYRKCRFCGVVWLIGRDVCPPHLRSMKENEQLRVEQLARRSA